MSWLRENLGLELKPDATKLQLKQGFPNYHKGTIIFLLVEHNNEVIYVTVSQGGW